MTTKTKDRPARVELGTRELDAVARLRERLGRGLSLTSLTRYAVMRLEADVDLEDAAVLKDLLRSLPEPGNGPESERERAAERSA